jgi:hypothetical protein
MLIERVCADHGDDEWNCMATETAPLMLEVVAQVRSQGSLSETARLPISYEPSCTGAPAAFRARPASRSTDVERLFGWRPPLPQEYSALMRRRPVAGADIGPPGAPMTRVTRSVLRAADALSAMLR